MNFNDLGFLSDSHMTMIRDTGMAFLVEIIAELKDILNNYLLGYMILSFYSGIGACCREKARYMRRARVLYFY